MEPDVSCKQTGYYRRLLIYVAKLALRLFYNQRYLDKIKKALLNCYICIRGNAILPTNTNLIFKFRKRTFFYILEVFPFFFPFFAPNPP
jgi:hypothetical protein